MGLADRIDWINRVTSHYDFPLYEHAAVAYRMSGSLESERAVRYAANRRSFEGRAAWSRIWGYVQDVTIGYGYKPLRALLWLTLSWILGWIYFSNAASLCSKAVPTPCPVNADQRIDWNPILVALDAILPFSIGQDGAWDFRTTDQAVALVLGLIGWVLISVSAAAILRATVRSRET